MPLFGPPDVDKLGDRGDVPGLIGALSYKKDSSVRAAAAEELMRVGFYDSSSVEPLIAALTDADWNVRRAAAVTLGMKRASSAARPLVLLLRDSDSDVRQAAANALGGIRDIRSVAPLIAALDDQNDGVRKGAAWSLGLIKDPRGTEALVKALKDKSEDVRQVAAQSLRFHGWEGQTKEVKASKTAPGPKSASKARSKDTSQAEPTVTPTPPPPRATARPQPAPTLPSQSTRKRPGGTPASASAIKLLLNDLGNANERVREAAAAALGQVGARAVEPLMGALADSSELVREAAIGALREIGAPGTKALVAGLADPDRHVRWRAADALGRIGDPKATKALTSALDDPDQYVREAAATALAAINGPERTRSATPPLAGSTTRSRRSVASALAASGSALASGSVRQPARSARVPEAGARAIRVFVSSTFRDMGAERDELVKHTFPALRKLCESRGVAWGEVDLRWGITEEEKAEGQVLPICLAEIARSRPYFIGLLGERYGWVPDAIEPATLEDEPWLAEHAGRSVTELEILHGVLNDPKMARHTFFYMRDPAYVEGKPTDQYRESTPEPAAKLAALKNRIRESGLPVREGYRDPRALGEAVLADLTAVIDSLYPEGSEPNPLARETSEHQAFAASRAGVYIGRPDYFGRLDAHASGDGLPLVVVGESGSGKSALLANWAIRYRAAHPSELVLTHFIGATPASTDWASMVRRIIGELKGRFDLPIEIPEKPDELRTAFAKALHTAAAKGRVILVLDALNQLEDREAALDLGWLPPSIPAKVRLVASSLPGRPLAEAGKRGFPTLEVKPLDQAEREQLIVDYLATYSRALGTALRVRIAGAPQCANPLYLRALLDELRVWGEHETLGERVDHYLAAKTVDALYELILARYEQDYERDRPKLVGDAFSLLWASRRGLSETELLDLLGTNGQPLPRAFWSPLYLAAEQSLTSRSGLLGFFHDYLRSAVEHRYLRTKHAKTSAHLRLADYFAGRETGPRKIDELPWQLAEASAWQRLADLLTDFELLKAAWVADSSEINALWARVEAGSTIRMVDVYRTVIAQPGRHETRAVFIIGVLLTSTGHPEEALAIQAHLVEVFRKAGDKGNLAASLGNQASILHRRGDHDGAMSLYKEQERLSRQLRDTPELLSSLGNQASVLQARGELNGAMKLNREVERICREIGDRDRLQVVLGNEGVILQALGDLNGAMALQEEKERICRELDDKASLQYALGNQARILYARGDLHGAMALHKEEERICRELGDPANLQHSIGNQALILQDWGEIDKSMALHKEKERICRELGDPLGLSESLGNQASLLCMRNDLSGGMALLKEVERICRENDDPVNLQRSLGNQALILKARGDLEGCMSLTKEQEKICRKLGDPEGLAISLINQAALLGLTMHRSREAIPLADEAYRIADQHGLTAAAQEIGRIRDAVRRAR